MSALGVRRRIRSVGLATAWLGAAMGALGCDGGSATTAAGGAGGAGGSGGTGGSGGASTTTTEPSTGGNGGNGEGGAFAIDECADGTATCAPEATCVDTPGFYECVCDPGYEGDGKTCTDIDECQLLTDDCDANAVCTNEAGTFSCACPEGYAGDGKTCSPLYASVAAGQFHACALRQDKTVWCWGLNTSGQVGTGTSDVYFHRPVSPSEAKTWKALTLGAAFTCALNTANQVFCWGTNTLGQFGDGTTTSKTSPSAAGGGTSDWAAIDAGTNHVCGIRADATMHCWGRNSSGQLGDGSKDNNGDGTADNELSPVPVAGGGSWIRVSAGADFSCGIKSDHSLWCWGLNSSRQLGDGTTTEAQAPVQEKSKTTDWAEVDATNAFTCAVKQDGTRWCWGANNVGQGADGTQNAITEPKQVDAETSWQVVQGSYDSHACGIKSDKTLHCWGDGSLGQTAQAGAESISLAPLQVGAANDWVSVAGGLRFVCGVRSDGVLSCWGAATRGELASGFSGDRVDPALVGTDDDWESLDVHTDTSCGLRAGNLFCWGRNLLTNLGDDTAVTRPEPIVIAAGTLFKSISLGRFFGCGVTGNDIACWGRDDSGQLANGTGVTHAPVPQTIAATANASPWIEVSAGNNGACGVKSDQTLWCWGADAAGQVGNGDVPSAAQHAPVQVLPAGAADWKSVRENGDAVCGLRGAGALWCWGRNAEGQLGLGNTNNPVTSPQAVGADTYQAFDTGGFHTCAIKSDGTLWCWGRNSSGELGLGNNVNPITTPTKVGGDTNWKAVFLGPGAQTCALKTTGDLYCWGANGFGQLGIGTYTGANTPQKVPAPSTWKTAALGNEHACGVQSDGRLFCWGASYSAQLGAGVPFLSTPTPALDPL